MYLNLLDKLQKDAGFAELKKIDPNTQQTKDDGKEEDKLNQAAIPLVLMVLYKFTRTDSGAQRVISESLSNEWMKTMLGDAAGEAAAKVAAYSDTTETMAAERMEMIARRAVGTIKESEPADMAAVKEIMSAEHKQILVHLPPTMHLGDLLNEADIDDNVNKMEGPVSNLMNAIGNIFSSSEREN